MEELQGSKGPEVHEGSQIDPAILSSDMPATEIDELVMMSGKNHDYVRASEVRPYVDASGLETEDEFRQRLVRDGAFVAASLGIAGVLIVAAKRRQHKP